ncbi:cubilin isoform X2, partial [Biomphalaria glabrata]
ILTLNFTRFDLEAAFCRYDYLDIFDGPSSSSSSLGRFCGSTLQGRLLTTTQHQVTLDFTSDQYDHFRGFSISWTSSDP